MDRPEFLDGRGDKLCAMGGYLSRNLIQPRVVTRTLAIRWVREPLWSRNVGGLVIVGVSVACIRDMLHYRGRWTVYSTRMMHFSDGGASFENDCNFWKINFLIISNDKGIYVGIVCKEKKIKMKKYTEREEGDGCGLCL